MITRADAAQPLPRDFHGFRLLAYLGGGYTSEVYLAEPLDPRSDAHVDLPRRVALKIACDKLDEYPGAYTPGLVVQIFEDQKEYMRRIEGAGGHPLIAKGYPDAPPEVRDTTIADPACCTLKMLQELLGPNEADLNPLSPALVKYVGASIFLVLEFLQSIGIFYADGLSHNTVITADFTLQHVDIGELASKKNDARKDARIVVCSLYSLLTGDAKAKYRSIPWLQEYLSVAPWRPEHPLFFDMLLGMLEHASPTRALAHSYWSSDEAGTVPVFNHTGGAREADLPVLAKTAYRSLPTRAQDWLASKGVLCELVEAR